jgi:16S rRNA (adenine1518-N6/adenine1519-N6)-dimethyltransferase
MVKKEVTESLNALSKKNHKKASNDVGAISYAIKYYANSKVIINVPKENFLPVPKVDSSVIVLDILETPAVETGDEKLLFKLIKTSYMQKRKTLVNSLVHGKIIDKDSLIHILETLNLDPRIRPEQLTLQDFANIAKLIQK